MNSTNDSQRVPASASPGGGSKSKASPKIFISYRRDDSTPHANHLYENLSNYFGDDNIFMDAEKIAAGADFPDVLTDAVNRCDVLIALIGGRWLTAASGAGRRLDDPADYVRREIATALEGNIRVIPVLVQGASMPGETELPAPLKALARRQAVKLRDESWRQDVINLAAAIGPRVERGALRRRLPFVVAALGLVLAVAVFFYLRPDGRKVVVVMDSYAPDVVYDNRTKGNDETNAHEIERILEPYNDQIRVDRELVGRGIYNHKPIVEKNPDLIIIHKSSFYGKTVEDDPQGRLYNFLRATAPTKAKFLIYTRSIPSDEAEKEMWKADFIEKIPELKGRLELFTFSKDPPTFLDSDVAAQLTFQVKAMLNLS